MDVKRAYRLCEERGCSEKTLRKARDELELKTLRVGRNEDRRFFWFRSDLEPAEIRAEILNQNEQLPLLERFPLEDLPAPPGDADAPVRNFRYS